MWGEIRVSSWIDDVRNRQKSQMTPADCNTKGCVFCNTTDPNLHVSYCNLCHKCICDNCRPKYGLRAAAAVDEHMTKVTMGAEALANRFKKWRGGG